VADRGPITKAVVRAWLRELIAEAHVGDRLPSERELSERWGVARMTVRHATDALISEGLLERRHGSGTYVVPQPMVRLLGLTSFSEDMRSRGMAPSSRLLAFRRTEADAATAASLHIPVGERIVNFSRLRLGDGVAMATETIWLPAILVPGLGPDDLGGSLYELLAQRYRIVPGSASVTIEPVIPDERTRKLLTIPDDQPCLRLRMVDSNAGGQVIMVADCVYRGDKYQLSAIISGAAFSPSGARRTG